MSKTEFWTRIDEPEQIRDEPWKMYWREWKTGSEAFEKFLHDPIGVLVDEIRVVQPDWSVTTTVANHQVGLSRSPICIVAMVVPEERRVYLWLYKHAPEASY
ncbi:hypothetical protein OG756_02095 [Streptomyces sp. NBC_01310]|uniref:hypothetical protein n=1 Tax=Streptomyces sp. NBC_01310 TaxID=2903820 RepID=UPI0035B65878|nr:hypothetical protein OG756_02095 [Streptomyces sp. NBC_01310]